MKIKVIGVVFSQEKNFCIKLHEHEEIFVRLYGKYY